MRPDPAVAPTRRLARLIPAAVGLLVSSCGGYGGGSTAPPAPTPTISFAVQPSTIVAGQSATLTWSTGSATSCTAAGAWSGNEPTSGSMAVTPATAGANTYTLNCTDTMSGPYGSSSSATQSVTLTVDAATAFAQKTLVADTASGTATVD